MVQFGKYLRNHIYEGWAEKYVDYMQLKVLITEGKTDEFAELLKKEIKKVDEFYAEMKHAVVDWCCANTDFAQRQVDIQVTEELVRLYNFCQLNREGFRKIVKKFDKNFDNNDEAKKFMKWILMANFFCDELLSKLLNNSGPNLNERMNSVWHASQTSLLETNDALLFDQKRICRDTSPRSLSVWTLNVCLTPALLREQYLSKHSVVVFFLTIAIGIKFFPWYCVLISLVTMFQSVFVVYTLIFISAVVGFIYLIITGHPIPNDFKYKRLDHLLKKIEKGSPDVICMQELQGTWYYDAYRHRFCNEMKNLGYTHQLVADRLPAFPSLFANSGLAIFSKYPILESDTLNYRYQLFYDYWTVNRACQYAKIKYDTQTVSVFNTHLGPSIFIVYPWLKDFGISILNPQAREYAEYIQSKVKLGDNIVAVGDYNMDPTSEAYEMITSRLRHFGVKDIGKHIDVKRVDEQEEEDQDKQSDMEYNPGEHSTGYNDHGFNMGYATWKNTCASSTKSHYLTGWQRPQCLDYCFTSLKKDSYVIDPLEVHDVTAPRLQQVSDHDAVLAKLFLPSLQILTKK